MSPIASTRSLAWAALDLYELYEPLDVPLETIARRAATWGPADLGALDEEAIWDEACFEFVARYATGLVLTLSGAAGPASAVSVGIARHVEWTVRRARMVRFLAERRRRLDRRRLTATTAELEADVAAIWRRWSDAGLAVSRPAPLLLSSWLGPADALCRRWLDVRRPPIRVPRCRRSRPTHGGCWCGHGRGPQYESSTLRICGQARSVALTQAPIVLCDGRLAR